MTHRKENLDEWATQEAVRKAVKELVEKVNQQNVEKMQHDLAQQSAESKS